MKKDPCKSQIDSVMAAVQEPGASRQRRVYYCRVCGFELFPVPGKKTFQHTNDRILPADLVTPDATLPC